MKDAYSPKRIKNLKEGGRGYTQRYHIDRAHNLSQ